MAIKIVKCFNESTYFLGQLRDHQKSLYQEKLIALRSPCDIRWNSYYNCFHNILKSKGALTVCIFFYL